MQRPRPFFVLAVAVLAGLSAAPAWADDGDSPAKLKHIVVENIPFDIDITAPELNAVPYSLMIESAGEAIFTHKGIIPAEIRNVRVPTTGEYLVTVTTAGRTWETKVRSVGGFITLLPPLIAILIALVFRQVYVALFAGVWIGGVIVNDNNVIRGFFYVIDHYVIESLAGKDGWSHASIAVFTLLLGGMVGVITRCGGASGILESISRLATTPKRGQISTWLMGLFIFFDDYTNTLIVGNTMRPITDRLRISREKLAYLVDSTAAPVACLAVVTSWIGFEISLLKEAFDSVGMVDRNPFTTFITSIPYSFYPILTLLFGLSVAWMGRDFGPMHKAEIRARREGLVLGPDAVPISNIDKDIVIPEDVPHRWINAVLPVAVVIVGTVLGLIYTGRETLEAGGAVDVSWFDAIRNGDSFNALLWSSFSGCVVAMGLAVGQRILSITDTVMSWVSGIKSMMPAIIILVLAWSIGKVCADLSTADYLVGTLSGVLAPELLPGLVFLVAAAVSFSTGTSWGTMTILTPLCVPLVVQITQLNDITGATAETILLSSIAAILSGAVFGDHCSPISDTTIMSSMASTSDHIDHVRTQLPYAVMAAVSAITFGYVLMALGIPLWVSLVMGAASVFATVRFIGKPVDA